MHGVRGGTPHPDRHARVRAMSDVVTPTIRAKRGDTAIAKFDRDMWRLKSLRDKYDNPGLNSVESSEAQDLLAEYGIEYNQWTRREMFK